MPSSQNDLGVFSQKLTPIDLGFTQVTVPAGVATKLPTVPAALDVLLLQPDKDVRYIDNGINTPTGSNGILIQANIPFEYSVSDFTFIEFFPDAATTGAVTLNVMGYSFATRGEI